MSKNKKAFNIFILAICSFIFGIVIDHIFLFSFLSLILFIASFVLFDEEIISGVKLVFFAIPVGAFLSILGYYLFPVSISFGIIFLIIGLILFFFGLYLLYLVYKVVFTESTPKPQPQEIYSSSSAKAVPPVQQDGTRDYHYLSTVVDQNILKYQYEQNMFLFGDGAHYLSGNGGRNLQFVPEPENEHDPGAIALYLNGHRIGYVYRGQTQDMIHSWIRKGYYFTGYLNKFSVAENKATYKIGFYKPLSLYPSEVFSLTKTSKRIDEFEKRSDNLSSCSVGESVSFYYNSFDDSYIVYNDVSSEIGELPKSAGKFLSGTDDTDIFGIIEELEDEFESSPKAKVRVYILNS